MVSGRLPCTPACRWGCYAGALCGGVVRACPFSTPAPVHTLDAPASSGHDQEGHAMPRAKHLCARIGCLERLPAGTSYCDEHRSRWSKRSDQERPDTSRAEHRRVRDAALTRDGHQCQLRLDCCIGTATELDHIVSKADGGPTTAANGQAACKPCHARRSARQGGQASAQARRSGALQEDPEVWRATQDRRTRKRRTPPEDWSPTPPIRLG
jgi:5-methylcytosine-specific restriction protein A